MHVSLHLRQKQGVNQQTLTNIPCQLVERILKRDSKSYRKENNKYYLSIELDDDIEKMKARKAKCEAGIDKIGNHLLKYLQEHDRCFSNFKTDGVIHLLFQFLSSYCICVGQDTYFAKQSSQKDKANYYIGQYILETKEQNRECYDEIIELVKGYYLKSAIYLQAENGNIKDAFFQISLLFLIHLLSYACLGIKVILKKKTAKNFNKNYMQKKVALFFFLISLMKYMEY